MPTPREAYANTVEQQGYSGARVRAADFGAGQIVARSVSQFGQQLGQVADDISQTQTIYATASAKDADNQIRQYYADTGFNGPEAYYNLSGKDAVAAKPAFMAGLEDKIRTVREQLTDPHARRMFDDAQGAQHAEWTQQIGAHEDREVTNYHKTETTARIGLASNAAVVAATMPASSDPNAHPLAESEKQIATANNEIASLGHASGLGNDAIKFQQAQNEAATRLRILHTFNSGGAKGPQVAQAYLDKHRDAFGDEVPNAQNAIRTMQNAQEAEARRQEAEARRVANEAKHDAGERAADVARTIHDGGVVSPEKLAQASADARQAERPALEDEIKQGALKNNLSLQYRDTPPAEILNDVNTLGAKITKAGAAATVEDRTAFAHLQTLYEKSRSELNQDPISWGAQHSGIDPGPLKLNDPASVAAHLEAGRKVSQRTGAPLRLMTNADADMVRGQLTAGTAAQRKAVMSNLARFGAVSQIAAAQIAPGNDALANAVGLAGGSNHVAAQQHLDMITAGEEVFKTNPKLISQGEADMMFAAHVGTALDLMPSAGRGARTNAANMAAYVAAHGGAADWGSGGRAAFQKTVNDALGGYKDPSGVIRGGIATINSRRTLLPDGWSSGDVETVIAKAPAAKWQGAWNAAPVDAKGQSFTFGQLRQMQMVAVGDGRYRLTDGAHYVGKKGGGFFELNVRKMR